MQMFRDVESIAVAVASLPDAQMRRLLADRLAYLAEEADEDDVEQGEGLHVALIEPGDSLDDIDAEMRSTFLVNHFSGKRFGEVGFTPAFETLEEYRTFFDMTFIYGDGALCVEVLVPKGAGVDPAILDLCARFAVPAPE